MLVVIPLWRDPVKKIVGWGILTFLALALPVPGYAQTAGTPPGAAQRNAEKQLRELRKYIRAQQKTQKNRRNRHESKAVPA